MTKPDREPVPEFIMIPRGGLLIRHNVPPGVDTNEKLLAWAASLVKAHEVDSLLAEHRKADPAFPDSPLAGLVTAADPDYLDWLEREQTASDLARIDEQRRNCSGPLPGTASVGSESPAEPASTAPPGIAALDEISPRLPPAVTNAAHTIEMGNVPVAAGSEPPAGEASGNVLDWIASHALGSNLTQEQAQQVCDAARRQVLDAISRTTATGNVPPIVGSEPPASLESPPAREEPLSVTFKRRMEREGRWREVSLVRDQMMKDAKAAYPDKEARRAWVYSELDRMYPAPAPILPNVTHSDMISESPHLSPYVPTKPISESASDSGQIQGLSDLPGDWPKLPANASMSVELAWVQANRLRLVTERPGRATLVDLSKAISPAPSWGALGWLETSIYSKAKFVEALVKVGGGDDEGESAVMKRERKSVDEVRALLQEMQAAEGTCPSCGKPF